MGKELECWIEDALIDPTVDLDDVVDTIANAVLEVGDEDELVGVVDLNQQPDNDADGVAVIDLTSDENNQQPSKEEQ